MHDLVNDMATVVSGDFYKRCDIGNLCEVGKQTRHFSYVQDLARLKVISKAKRLRSLMALDNGWQPRTPHLHSKILRPLKLMRTLILSNGNMKKLASSIGNLKLLRYLDLSYNFKLIHLPESVDSLYNLEVLILEGCDSLTKLPSKMRQLTKLNHLNIRRTKLQEMPMQMGSLKDLDVLTDFVVGKGSGSSIAELKELKDLRGELHIHGLQNISHLEDALVANLKEKTYLEELWLEWNIDHDNSEDARIILENLIPHVNLKQLRIEYYSGTRLPDWSGHYSFVNLVFIQLVGFKHCFHLLPLGELPSLESLSVCRCDSLVTLTPVELPNKIHDVGHFSALQKLSISGCPNFTYFHAGKWCAPKMTYLWLDECESLKVMPENMCDVFPSLLQLEVIQCPNLALPQSGLPRSLSTLEITRCSKLIANCSSWGLQRLLSLSTLKICSFVCDDSGTFPEEGLLPSSLSTLWIEDVPNLRSLNGKSFHFLTSLETLRLRYCTQLRCLPELPTSMSTLIIEKCPRLEARCQREQGEDWSKIAHIPNIEVSRF